MSGMLQRIRATSRALLDRNAVNRDQFVAEVDLGLIAGTAGANVDRQDVARPVRVASIGPSHPVVGDLELAQLLEVDDGSNDRRGAQHQQQSIRELASQAAHRSSGLSRRPATSPFRLLW